MATLYLTLHQTNGLTGYRANGLGLGLGLVVH